MLNASDELVIISETMAVVRDGIVTRIPVDQLVLDDIVILSREAISADAELVGVKS